MKYLDINNIKFPDITQYPLTDKLFLDNATFVNYIDTIFKKQNICTINLKEIDEYFIEVNLENLTYKISQKFTDHISKCLIKKNVEYLIIPIALAFPKDFEDPIINDQNTSYRSYHSNVVIIDLFNNIVEFFEPHGIIYKGSKIIYNTEFVITSMFMEIFSNIGNFTFKNVFNFCPNFGIWNRNDVGIQQNDNFCLAWSLLFVELRLKNKNLTSETIINTLLSLPTNYTLDYIKKYISYIQTKPINKGSIFKSVLEIPIKINNQKIIMSDVVLVNDITTRVNYLLNNYISLTETYKMSNELYLSVFSININTKMKLLFNELLSYQSTPGFYDYILQFLSNYKPT